MNNWFCPFFKFMIPIVLLFFSDMHSLDFTFTDMAPDSCFMNWMLQVDPGMLRRCHASPALEPWCSFLSESNSHFSFIHFIDYIFFLNPPRNFL